MLYVRFPLSLRNVEDLLHERGIEISHSPISSASVPRKILALGKIAVTEDQIANQVRHDMALHKAHIRDVGQPGSGTHSRTATGASCSAPWVKSYAAPSYRSKSGQQHAEIVKAISTGDAEDAERLIISHDLEAAETLHTALLAQERP